MQLTIGKVKKSNLNLIVQAVLVVILFLTPHTWESYNKNYWYIGKIIFGAYLILRLFASSGLRRLYRLEVNLAILYAAVMIYSTVYNQQGNSNILAVVSYAFTVVGLICWGIRSKYIYGKKFIYVVFCTLSAYTLANAIYMFVQPSGASYSIQGGQRIYLIGDKFMTAYELLVWLISATLLFKNSLTMLKKMLLAIMSVYILYVELSMGGTTGIVMLVLFWSIVLLTNRKVLSFLMRPAIILGILAVCTVVLVLYQEKLFSNQFFSNLIVNVLNKDLTMTNRTVIYSKFPEVFIKAPILGTGYNANGVFEAIHTQNFQNSYLQTLFSYGLAGMISFALLILIRIRYYITSRMNAKYWLAGVLVFLIIALVEIPLQEYFVFLLILMPDYEAIKTPD